MSAHTTPAPYTRFFAEESPISGAWRVVDDSYGNVASYGHTKKVATKAASVLNDIVASGDLDWTPGDLAVAYEVCEDGNVRWAVVSGLDYLSRLAPVQPKVEPEIVCVEQSDGSVWVVEADEVLATFPYNDGAALGNASDYAAWLLRTRGAVTTITTATATQDAEDVLTLRITTDLGDEHVVRLTTGPGAAITASGLLRNALAKVTVTP